jgi:hypothetical protein
MAVVPSAKGALQRKPRAEPWDRRRNNPPKPCRGGPIVHPPREESELDALSFHRLRRRIWLADKRGSFVDLRRGGNASLAQW